MAGGQTLENLAATKQNHKELRLLFFRGQGFHHQKSTVVDKDLTDLNVFVAITKFAKSSIVVNPESVTNSTTNRQLVTNERHITQFLEIAVNQVAIMNPNGHKVYENGKSFMCDPMAEGFTERDCVDVGDGKRLLWKPRSRSARSRDPTDAATTTHLSSLMVCYLPNTNILIVTVVSFLFVFSLLIVVLCFPSFSQESCLPRVDDCHRKANKISGEQFDKEIAPRLFERINSVLKGVTVETLHLKKARTFPFTGISKHTALSTALRPRKETR